MIGVHVLWHWGAPDTWTSPIGQVISFLGGPTAAPVFMFLMGASLAFSSRTSFRSLAVRGLWLLWLGYLLNFLRGVIPAYLGLTSGVVTAEQIAPFTLPWLATTVDVHHMAGPLADRAGRASGGGAARLAVARRSAPGSSSPGRSCAGWSSARRCSTRR